MNKLMKQVGVAAATLALVFAVAGVAVAASVTPTEVVGNITFAGNGNNDTPDCAVGDRIEIAGPGQDTDGANASGTSTNGVTVNIDYHSGDKGLDFTVVGGTVTIAYIKGSNSYNMYDYGSPGVTSDTGLFSPNNGSTGPAGVSHTVWCTAIGGTTTTTTSDTTTTTTTSDATTTSDTTTTTTTSGTTTTTTTSGTTTTTTTTDTFTSDTAGETDAPSEPNTATIGTSTGAPADGAWLLVIALGVLLASIVVLTPAKARR